MSEKEGFPLWKRILFPRLILEKSAAGKIAYLGVLTALCIVVNLFEFKFMDVQFSFTVFASMLAGILIGPIFGFVAVFLGDTIGYFVNNWGLVYMPWVGLSVAAMALIAGLVMEIPLRFRGGVYVKLAVMCLLSLLLCSVGINTTGMYFYYTHIGFSERSLSLLSEHFGGTNTYFTYAIVRLFFMGQIWNNLMNFVLLFVSVPTLAAIKPLGLKFQST